MLNTAVAMVLREFTDELEDAPAFDSALSALIRRELAAHRQVLFNGNGYGTDWPIEAQRRDCSTCAPPLRPWPAMTIPRTWLSLPPWASTRWRRSVPARKLFRRITARPFSSRPAPPWTCSVSRSSPPAWPIAGRWPRVWPSKQDPSAFPLRRRARWPASLTKEIGLCFPARRRAGIRPCVSARRSRSRARILCPDRSARHGGGPHRGRPAGGDGQPSVLAFPHIPGSALLHLTFPHNKSCRRAGCCPPCGSRLCSGNLPRCSASSVQRQEDQTEGELHQSGTRGGQTNLKQRGVGAQADQIDHRDTHQHSAQDPLRHHKKSISTAVRSTARSKPTTEVSRVSMA